MLWRRVLTSLFAFLLCFSLRLPAAADSLADLDKAGAALIGKGDFAKAEQLYQQALDQARQEADRPWTAEFLRRLGEVRQRMQDWKGALSWYEQSLPIRQELGQKPEIALLLVGTGLVKLRLGDLAGGVERLESGRSLYHELGDAGKEAEAILLLAQVAAVNGNFEKADDGFRDVLALFEERKMVSDIAATHAAHAELYFRRSLYRDALAEGFAAIDTAVDAAKTVPEGDAHRNLLTTEANARETVGNTYRKMVQLPRALDYYQRALSIRLEVNDSEKAASTRSNMAPVLVTLGRTAEAVASLEEALTVRRAIGNPVEIASTLTALGEVNLVLGKPVDARKRYEEALKLTAVGSPSQGVALYQLGMIALEAGQLEEALSFHQRALEIRQKGRNPHDIVRSWSQIALIQEKRGDLADADAAFVQAMSGFEKLSLEVSDPVQLAAFRETAARLYPTYARVLFKEGKTGEALSVAERGRGQALARMSGGTGSGFLEALNSSERSGWDQAAATLSKAANRFRIAIEQKQSDQQQTDARAAWLEAKLALSRTRERIFAGNARLRGTQPPVPELSALLQVSKANPRTLYLEWLAVDDTSTMLFSIAAGESKGYLLPLGASELRKQVADWRSALVQGKGRGFTDTEGAKASQPEPASARGLYRAAMGPLAADLETGPWDRVVAIPDGPLLDAPIAALITPSGKRLIERFAVSTAVSLHSIGPGVSRPAAASTFLAIADPSEKGKQRAVIPSGAFLDPLAQARAEAASIARDFPGAVNLTGADARESEVKHHLDCCSILHFATHGILDFEDGLDSGLLLAAEPEGSSEDGVLQAWEIANMRLNARLAVLSACDSARGGSSAGEGLMGLAWAFQAAGTPAVVASLWSVDDAATADLMRAFYAALKTGARSDDALQQAMRKLQGQKANSSPYFWAAFSLIGHSDAIQ